MATEPSLTSATTAEKVDRITRDLLAELELQTQVALTLLERAPETQREAFLERVADVRGRLVRLRAVVLGRTEPKLVGAAKPDVSEETT